MNYDDENWIKVYTRDTAGWLSVSWQARGLMLELSRKLPKNTGELSLGRKGLSALGALLRASWSEIEPFIAELIDDGRLQYDAETQTIRDVEHPVRQNAVSSDAERKRRQRDREATERDIRPKTVTLRHVTSRDVTPDHYTDTPGHDESPKEEKEKKEKKEKIPPYPPRGETPVPEPTRFSKGSASALEAKAAFEQAVSVATGNPFVLTRAPYHVENLCDLLDRHAPAGITAGLAWIAPTVTSWVQSTDPTYSGGWVPAKLLDWLNAKKPDRSNRKSGAEITKQPFDENAPWMKAAGS